MRIDLRPPVVRGVRLSKVDYLAFTIPDIRLKDDEACGRWSIAYELVMQTNLGRIEDEETRTCWEVRKGRGFYAWMCHNREHNLTIHWGGSNPHAYVECTGLTCDRIREAGVLDALIQEQLPRLSRIDLCSDLDIEDKPSSFVDKRKPGRMKISGSQFSVDGDTIYVGSRKGERYARVYRYHPPHPRSQWLRVEHVFHGKQAKSVASILLNEGLASAIDRAGNVYGWQHPAWLEQSVEAAKLPAARYDREQGGRVRWLYTTVPQALLQSHKDGLIDLKAWYEQFLKDVLEGE